ncbi:cupin domain-containing protein [Caballeronia sp. LZ065]|uniref:cupin domain-containing protein n=1 Tax=Caballeronia sp. LZ065 TaxID=3038571 RepID=UPI0028673545|nr:cupin domain-containing protein [Caballeronia sp. LZ065]MDR5784773.1 cupin domain-containing protein [Caballeronia sp. LZ065]
MSLLVSLDTAPGFAPQPGAPLPERLISGNPQNKTWLLDEAFDGKIQTGIWESTPGANRSIRGEMFEFCHILSGVVEITEDGGSPVRYGPGDSFLIKPGFTGVWRNIETVRKIFVIYE